MVDPAAFINSLQLPDGAVPDHVFVRRWAWARNDEGDLELLIEALSPESQVELSSLQVPRDRASTDGWSDGVAVMLAYTVPMSAGEVEVIGDAHPDVASALADIIAALLGVHVSTYDGLR